MAGSQVPEVTAYPIPRRLNFSIAGTAIAGGLGLLWLGSHGGAVMMWVSAVVFSFLMLTTYALIHEATHNTLHPDVAVNQGIGVVLSWFFPTSFSVLRLTHIVHHRCNRTDHEMFDYYYPEDSRLIKWIQWYGILLGLWWWLIPLGTILFAFVPRLARSAPFKRARSSAIMFDDFGKREIWQVRAEIVGAAIFWIIMFHLLSLSWNAVFAAYLCFSINWSTRQYVTHAFTPRDVRTGALNLKVGPAMSWILLRGHWDLVHHMNPHLPWVYLPELGRTSRQPVSYWRQYFQQWRGPRIAPEPAPQVLSEKSYHAMR